MVIPNNPTHTMRTPDVMAMPNPTMMPAVVATRSVMEPAMTVAAGTDVGRLTFMLDLRHSVRGFSRCYRRRSEAEKKNGGRNGYDFHGLSSFEIA
jgi:hypothetical protein